MKLNSGRKKIYLNIAAGLLFFTGLLMYLYPFACRTLNDKNSGERLETFRFTRAVYTGAEDAPIVDDNGEISQTEAQKQAAELSKEEKYLYDPTDLLSLRKAMLEYNQELIQEGQSGLADAWSYEEPPFDLSRYGVYDQLIGELRVPAMNCDLPLFLGATNANMAYGAAMLGQTSMPVGGADTNCVIAAHRGCVNGAYFLYIQNLSIGDKVYLDNYWETMTYRVSEINVIDPDDREAVLIQKGRDMLTLITCHPYPFNYQRYAVYCERCENDPVPEEKDTPSEIPETGGSDLTTGHSSAQTHTENMTEMITETSEEVRRVTADSGSDTFIRVEAILNYAVPAVLAVLIILLIVIRLFEKLRRR